MNENMKDAIKIPIWAFLHIFIKEVCMMERNNNSSPNAANPAIMNKLRTSPPIVLTFANLSIISVADSCISFIISSSPFNASGSCNPAFHSLRTALNGIMTYMSAMPIPIHKSVVFFNPNDANGLSFTNMA